MEKWNEICSDIIECQKNNVSERRFQDTVCWTLRSLGWLKNEIKQQLKVDLGAAQRVFPDIVLEIDSIPQIIIELKKPTHNFRERDSIQLTTYMKQLICSIGFYIGENIQIYYYNKTEEPQLVSTLPYETDSEMGLCFVELMKRSIFDVRKWENYCLTQIEQRKQEEDIETTVNNLVSDNGKAVLYNLLRTKLGADGHQEDSIDAILNRIDIILVDKSSKDIITVQESHSNILKEDKINHSKSSIKKRIYYSLNGNGRFCKRELALSIAKLYVKEHPHLTFSEIETRLPGRIYRKERFGEVRCFKEESQLMKSADGIIFALTDQWGKGCPFDSDEMIRFAKRNGYKIEEL